MIEITINDKHLSVEPGTTILAAARSAGIPIPTLCFLKDQNAIGSCRVCSVEVEGVEGLVSSCNTPVSNDMVVHTDTERVRVWRRMVLEIIAANVDLEAINPTSEFARLCKVQKIEADPRVAKRPRKPIADANPFLRFDPNLCIRCQRCVGACNNSAHNHAMQTGKKGTRTTIRAPFGENWKSSICESCGMCEQACPTGAIATKKSLTLPGDKLRNVLTTCPHCGVGCQVYLDVLDDSIVGAHGAPGASNKGRLCVKGRFASFEFVNSEDRLRTPLVKNKQTGEFDEATWDEALDLVAQRFSAIKEQHGGEALAAFACSRSTNEDVYLFQKMGRMAFESNNIDNCARV